MTTPTNPDAHLIAEKKPEGELRIVAAAVIHAGVIHTAPHHHLAMWQISCCRGEKAHGDQGFVASDGKFYGREDAYKIAKAAGQIRFPLPYQHADLYSEELWSYADWLKEHKMGDSPDASAPTLASDAPKEDETKSNSEAVLDELTNAFLRWPLPESVRADLCATQQGGGRIGTNLMSFVEAKQMFRDIVGPLVLANRIKQKIIELQRAEPPAPQAGTPTPELHGLWAVDYVLESISNTRGVALDGAPLLARRTLNEVLRPELTKLTAQLAALAAERDDLQHRVAALVKGNDEIHAGFSKEYHENLATITQLRASLAAAEQKVGELEKELNDTRYTLRHTQEAIETMHAVMDEHFPSLPSASGAMTDKINAVAQLVAQLKNECAEAKRIYNQVVADHCDNATRLQTALTAANSARDGAIKERDEARRPWTVALIWPDERSPFDTLECEVNDVGYADHVMNVICPEAERERESLRTQLASALARIEELEGRK